MTDQKAYDWHAYISIHVERWQKNPTFEHFSAMAGIYIWLAEHVAKNETDATARQVALDFFPIVMSGFASNKGSPHSSVFNNLLQFIPQKTCIDQILKADDGETALAWFCCTQASCYVFNAPAIDLIDSQRERAFITLLENWSGKPFPKKTAPQLPLVATYLYGQLCWDLYGTECGWPLAEEALATTVFDITMSKLPFVFKENMGNAGYNPSQPPSDMVV